MGTGRAALQGTEVLVVVIRDPDQEDKPGKTSSHCKHEHSAPIRLQPLINIYKIRTGNEFLKRINVCMSEHLRILDGSLNSCKEPHLGEVVSVNINVIPRPDDHDEMLEMKGRQLISVLIPTRIGENQTQETA